MARRSFFRRLFRFNALGLSLFWRTFFLLALLLAGGIFAWLQTLRAMEFEPRAMEAAQQTARLVNLARAALKASDGINRVALLKGLKTQDAARVTPREPTDRWEDYETDRYTRRVGQELRSSLGKHSEDEVNDPWGQPYLMLCGDSAPQGCDGFCVQSNGPDKRSGTDVVR